MWLDSHRNVTITAYLTHKPQGRSLQELGHFVEMTSVVSALGTASYNGCSFIQPWLIILEDAVSGKVLFMFRKVFEASRNTLDLVLTCGQITCIDWHLNHVLFHFLFLTDQTTWAGYNCPKVNSVSSSPPQSQRTNSLKMRSKCLTQRRQNLTLMVKDKFTARLFNAGVLCVVRWLT